MRKTFYLCGIVFASLIYANTLLAGVLASGSVELKKGLEAQAKGIKTLFVVIYNLESKRPMPYGAVRFQLKQDAKGVFHKFTLTTDNVQQMMPSPVPKKMRIKARLDKDGSAGMDRPGDIVGEIKPVQAGSKDIKIVLSKVK